MKIGLAGDWHGRTMWARRALATFAQHDIHDIIQLGDFGVGWPGGWNKYINEVNGACHKWDQWLLVVPGNHENYDFIEAAHGEATEYMAQVGSRVAVMPRGFRANIGGRSIVALGGAPSIDYERRQEGRTWWKAEAITDDDVARTTRGGHADIMVTHDAPDGGTDEVQKIIQTPQRESGWTHRGLAYAAEGRALMTQAFHGVKPKVFAHGHYHVADEKQVGDTKFLSLGCDGARMGNLVILDLETLEHEWVEVIHELDFRQ
jgi:predicted phosphodiesterase